MAMASNLYNEGGIGNTGPSAGANAATAAALIRGSPLRASDAADSGPPSADHQAATAINNRIL